MWSAAAMPPLCPTAAMPRSRRHGRRTPLFTVSIFIVPFKFKAPGAKIRNFEQVTVVFASTH